MRQKLIVLFCAALCLCGLAACAGPERDLCRLFSEDGKYTGFENMPEYDTPEAALKDGCLVVASDADGKGALYGGAELWTQFLSDSGKGKDAFLRIITFIDGTPHACDLLYTGGAYHDFDAEWTDLSDRPYQYLRKLTGTAGSPPKDTSWYVLTDSEDLTFDDAYLSFITDSTETMNSIPEFCWLGFAIYLDQQ